MTDKNLVLIAAGGTGGHIFPGLAIAQALEREQPGLRIEFIGSPEGLEGRLVPKAGYKLHPLSIGRLNRNVRSGERLFTLFRLPFVLLRALWLVWRLRPRFVLGVGGAVTGPSVLAAAGLRRRAFLWEPNAHPGLANRWLAPFVNESLVVFPEAAKQLKSRKTVEVGMPVRQNIERLSEIPHDGDVDKGTAGVRRPLRVLVFGGSQGARGINNAVSELLVASSQWRKKFEFVHQTGASDFPRVQRIYQDADVKVEVLEFIHDMDVRYKWADLVIARSGTGTVSELAAAGKAAILVPLPTAADNHQLRNAEALVRQKGAILIEQRDLTAARLKQLLDELEVDRTRLAELGKSIRLFHKPHADVFIARHLLEASQ